MHFTAIGRVPLLIVALNIWLLGMSTAIAQEYLPPGVKVIDAPVGSDLTIGSVVRTENHLVVAGISYGSSCATKGLKCSTLHFYESNAGEWTLQQSVEFARVSNTHLQHVGKNKIAIRRLIDSVGTGHDAEISEYELNTTTNLWEPTFVLRDYPYLLGYHEGTYLVPCDGVICAHISFVDKVNGNWQVTDILPLTAIRTYDQYFILDMKVQNGFAYVMFCGDFCGDHRDIVVIDIDARAFVNDFEIPRGSRGTFAMFGDQVIITADDGRAVPPFQPPQVYDNIANTWVYLNDAVTNFEWRHDENRIAWNDTTLFEARSPRLENEPSDAVIFYQKTSTAVWEQVGSILIPNGEGILNNLSLVDVYGDKVYFVEGYLDTVNRIFEVSDYHDYMDLDKDIMPLWWEQLYGFSPNSFDDFLGDTDNDGLSDVTEYGLQTSPVNSDTDNDQMPDGWEVQYSFNPHDSSDGDEDYDLDGYSNRYEFLNGMDPTFRDGNKNVSPPAQPGGGGTTGIVLLLLLFIGCTMRRFKNRQCPLRLRNKIGRIVVFH